MGKVRLSDIAGVVGVSTVTVHNALTGQKGVGSETREKILKAAKDLGYEKSPEPAKTAKKRNLRHVGVLISERYLAEYTTFYWKMYQEVTLEAAERHCLVTVEILRRTAEKELILPGIIEEQKLEGLMIMGEISRDYIRLLREKTGIPIVCLDFYDSELERDAVISDNFHGMYLLTEYLFARGYQKMAYLGSIHYTSSIMDRYLGFHKSMLEHGICLPGEWLIGDRDEEGHIEFELPEDLPEAFVCNCDLTAGMLIQKLEERGLRVPEDIAVVGFDNYLHPGFPDQKITTYEVNRKDLAKAAMEKLMKQIQKVPSGYGLEIIAGHIVEKESVGCKKD
ncbi:MAG: LacI family DNA-binding transcriptional regulator [Fusicatenibacter sp.]|nr:LacI family DNA-binding transcriptional regulator [Lachnospiraceae bacterium]MDY2936780.1 LacI family DNA-binding transcriptional regulator [Fusicatenibacter sp.]